jgi:diguanylate cyclase (GGDEF)-like protein/putative nucleotidyltransferase with HDIG domain
MIATASKKPPNHPAYRSFFLSVVTLGLGFTAISCYQTAAHELGYQWLILASLTVITGSFTVRIPGVNSKVSVADTFIFTNIVLFGPAAGTVTAALDGLAGSIRAKTTSRRLEFTLFNTANMALSAQLAGVAFYGILGKGPLYGIGPVRLRDVLIPMAILGLVHYISNSGAVAVMVALETRSNLYRIWRDSFLWTSIAYLSCASVSVLIAVNASAISPFMSAALLPVMIVVYFEYKAHQEKTEEQIKNRQLNDLYLRTVESLALAVDAKDQTTHSHIRRVRAFAEGLAALCGITGGDELMAIRTGALLHDIGKLAVDDYILNKPGKLTMQEFDKMKMHALAGHEIVEQIQFPFPVAAFVRGHHERWDGRGYPDGLKGEEIPLGARILSIADAFDAMRSWRPYKTSLSMQDSLHHLRSKAGSEFDPNLVDLFIRNIDHLENAATEASKDTRELSFRNLAGTVNPALVPAAPPQPHHPLAAAATAELLSLYEFCASLAQHLELQDLYVNIAQRIRRLVPYDLCAFYLEKGNGTVKVDYAVGKYSDRIQNLALQVGKGLSGWVAAYHQPMINTGAAMEFHGADFDHGSLKDSLVVPLMVDQTCIGTISLFAEDPMSYSQEQLSVLQVVSRHVAPALADARKRAASKSEQRQIEIETRAYHASYLSVVASRLMASSGKTGSPFSLIYLDLNNFSQLVRLCGADTGDAILKQVAERLRQELRNIDFLVQFGRKGFVALVDGMGREASIQLAQRLQRRIREIKMGNIAGQNVFIFQQTGIATYPEDGTTITTLLEAAQRHLAMRAGLQDPGQEMPQAMPRVAEQEHLR